MAEEEPQKQPQEKPQDAPPETQEEAPQAAVKDAPVSAPETPESTSETSEPVAAMPESTLEASAPPPLEQLSSTGNNMQTSRVEFEQLPVLDLGELEKFVNRYDDVPMKVSIELGRVTKTLSDILEWQEGSVVETKKLSGMPMEIMVNGSLFGHGEVVVVGDNLAIRITDLQKPNLD